MAANCPESCGKCDGSGGPAHDAAMQESIIKIVSDYGVIRIRLRPDWEKDLVADILGLFLEIFTGDHCKFEICCRNHLIMVCVEEEREL